MLNALSVTQTLMYKLLVAHGVAKNGGLTLASFLDDSDDEGEGEVAIDATQAPAEEDEIMKCLALPVARILILWFGIGIIAPSCLSFPKWPGNFWVHLLAPQVLSVHLVLAVRCTPTLGRVPSNIL